ncbi:AAA family ATPase, partial [Frankia sp. CNm7]|uniref:ATP-binding protein n=1 Tax=Frankia nepalensis TaxID=1836974 RepID=UPI001932E322
MRNQDRPFVGRQDELTLLRSCSRTAAEGRGQVVLVTGPAGIGKTRLVEEALRPDAPPDARAQAGPAGAPARVPVGRGYCPTDHAAPALWPWQQALRALARHSGRPAGFTAALDLLESAGTRHAPDDAASAAAMRFAALAGAADAVLSAAAEPLVIVLEDLHWADTNSVELLRQVAGGIVDSRLLLITTLRALPDEAGDAARELSRLDSVQPVPLRPLTTAAVRDYLASLGPLASSTARAEEVARRSGGLPLLLDAAARDAGAPGTVAIRDLVEALLAQLPEPARRVAQVAALLREATDAELVGQVAGVDGSTAARALDAAYRAGLLTRTASPAGAEARGFEFAHGLLADGLADLLGAAERREIHRRAAVALQARPSTVPGLAAEVAGHWRRAGRDEEARRRAAQWARRAAAESVRALAYDDAATHLLAAVEAARQAGAGDPELAETTLELARAYYLAGALAEALRHCEQAAEAAQRAGRGDLMAAAALVVRWVNFPLVTEAVPRLCRMALATPQPPAVRAQLLSQLAAILSETASGEAARQHVDDALELARASGDAQALLDAARAREMLLTGPDDAQERLRGGPPPHAPGPRRGPPRPGPGPGPRHVHGRAEQPVRAPPRQVETAEQAG